MHFDPATIDLLSRHVMALCFLTAAVTSAVSRKWGYAIFYGLAIVETYVRLRYPLHVQIKEMLEGLAFNRANQRIFQAELMMILAGVSILGAALLAFLLRKAPHGVKIMALATVGVLGMFATEMISLHSIDAIIYRANILFARNVWVYIGCALLCSAGALIDRARLRSQSYATNEVF